MPVFYLTRHDTNLFMSKWRDYSLLQQQLQLTTKKINSKELNNPFTLRGKQSANL